MQPHSEVWGGIEFQLRHFGDIVWSVTANLTFLTLAAEFVSRASIASVGFLKGSCPNRWKSNDLKESGGSSLAQVKAVWPDTCSGASGYLGEVQTGAGLESAMGTSYQAVAVPPAGDGSTMP